MVCETEYRKAQVVVMRSTQGFADRLAVLNQCLLYCLKYHAVLCVDWTDDTWGQEFSEMFEMLGIFIVPKHKVLEMMDQGATVNCPWTREDLERPLNEKTLGDAYVGDWMNTDDAVRFKTPQPTEEILITNGRGRHLTDYRLLCLTMRLRPDIADIVRSHIPTTAYCMVHLRGTDRKVDGFLENMIEGFRNIYTQWKDIYVIADDHELLKYWMTEFPNCKLYSKVREGINHLSTPTQLSALGTTKKDMNLTVLCDFFGLMSADARFGMTDSLFFSLPTTLRHCGGLAMI